MDSCLKSTIWRLRFVTQIDDNLRSKTKKGGGLRNIRPPIIEPPICSSCKCLDYFENLKEFGYLKRKVFRKVLKGSSASHSGICTDRQSGFCAFCTCGRGSETCSVSQLSVACVTRELHSLWGHGSLHWIGHRNNFFFFLSFHFQINPRKHKVN